MIYCVEDEQNIRALLLYSLQSSGYQVRGFAEGAEFKKALEEQKPELILLDIMLPGEDGLSLLRRIRQQPATQDIPVILITAKGTEYDKVQGLEAGADDYIAKPFGMMEFLARVKAVMRRCGKKKEEGKSFSFGELQLLLESHQVLVNGEEVQLTLKEFELLHYLLEHVGLVLSRDQILSRVWEYDFDGETRTVDVHVRSLRQKLGEAGSYIQTVRGVGYRIGGKS